MNTIGSNFDLAPNALTFEPSVTGEEDWGCTTSGDVPRPQRLLVFSDGVDQDARGKGKPSGGTGGGTVTCGDGTTPLVTTSDDGSTVIVVCEEKKQSTIIE